MSTNFFADWKVNENVTVRLHIGKRTRDGFSLFSGAVFPTVEAWKTFLTHNIGTVTVVSEYREEFPTLDFIRDEIDTQPRGGISQKEWLTSHGYVIHPEPVPAGIGKDGSYWHDGDRLFYNGEFS